MARQRGFGGGRGKMKMPRRAGVLWAGMMLLGGLFLPAGNGATWREQKLKAGDIRIRYLDAGSGDRTLVFIPGWTMPAEAWQEQIPYFSARGFRVLALDPRSHGETTKTEQGNTYRQQAADLHAFLQELKIEHSYLVGWGAGGTALLEYLASPETIDPDMAVFVDFSPAFMESEDYAGVPLDRTRKLLLGFQDDRTEATDGYVRGLFRSGPSERVIGQLSKASLKTPMAAALALYFDLVTGDRREDLRHITVPSLFVTTPENRALGEYLKKSVPRSGLEIIEGTGSAMFLEKPQAFNQALESFFGGK